MTSPTLYFAFGSNLWKQQMSLRCPSSTYVGIGRLCGYEWFINARGYANIAPSAKDGGPGGQEPGQEFDGEVWGLVYELTHDDEARVDANEGVPYAYEKQTIPVEFWPASPSSSTSPPRGVAAAAEAAAAAAAEAEAAEAAEAAAGAGAGKATPMLVYVDTRRNRGGYPPRDEYVHRMNAGIRDALDEGVPAAYVRRVLRRYIPPPAEGEEEAEEKAGGKEGEGKAAEQATGFADSADASRARAAALTPVGSGVVSPDEGEKRNVGSKEDEEELRERASEVCYAKYLGI
ncbi:hypothetical protein MYCTH_2297267 [Thermothelomyces thermophilus ATCC 42464]|uniref:gamma-glutamylcyclotransferase n=1 Tax=Thermothelomyces thermophilus (strain ATCC 42464 / BCRC 31852 / DSM 1799) TaxID=573729 RepID=G2Q532_THET4|nr:uncharacterized protein MYCTH_2297267 [Thermothelomyces thermophilus ATCC 42464]AEO54570.1 hypothetical protein MYCTH_2297267 [Thermothelomyces thermophilus ATCC 42464]